MLVPDEYSSERERRLDEAIAEYYQRGEAGEAVGVADFLARHTDLADDLVVFFADKAAFERRLGAPAPPAVADPAGNTHLHAEDTAVQVKKPPVAANSFGDYELIEEASRGSDGVVWRARQVSANRLVALKLISSNDLTRFRAAVKAAAGLDHPHILPILDAGEIAGQPYVATRWVAGRSLAASLPDRVDGRRRAVEILVQVARAVHHAHQRGVAHRKLATSNVLLDADGTPYIADFGLADRTDEAKAEDVLALGAILHECLTGQRLASPPSPSRALPRDLDAIVRKSLEKSPDRRYASAAALANDLERWLRGQPIASRPAGAWLRGVKAFRRRPVATALVVLVLVVVAATAVMFGRHRSPSGNQAGPNPANVSADSLTHRAQVHLDEERFDEAEADFSRAIEKDPKSREAWLGRGEAHAEQGKWNEADRDFAQVVFLDPDHADGWNNRLLVLLAVGRSDDYRSVLARMMGQFGPRNDLAPACVRIPAATDVVTLLHVVFSTPPGKAGVPTEEAIEQQAILGAALCRVGLHDAAVRELLAVEKQRTRPAAADALFLALSYQGRGEKDRARRAFQQAERLMQNTAREKAGWRRRVVWKALRQEVATRLE